MVQVVGVVRCTNKRNGKHENHPMEMIQWTYVGTGHPRTVAESSVAVMCRQRVPGGRFDWEDLRTHEHTFALTLTHLESLSLQSCDMHLGSWSFGILERTEQNPSGLSWGSTLPAASKHTYTQDEYGIAPAAGACKSPKVTGWHRTLAGG